VNRRWIAGLIALVGLAPGGARAISLDGDLVADRFSFPVGAVPNNPTTSRYNAPNGRGYLGWSVHPAASFLSPAFGMELQAGEDWGGRGGGDTDVGQPVYAAAAGTIVAAGYYGPRWGNIVLIRHTLPGGQVVLTQYAYLGSIVKNAGTVALREVIGTIGSGPRGSVLHFEVRRDSMVEYPPDYSPSSDGKDYEWVRSNYFSPTQFIRTHYLIRTPTPPTPPGEPGGNPIPTPNPEPGTGNPSPGTPGNGNPPGIPGNGTPPPVTPVWDGVPHLDGSLLRSAAGAYYLLQSGKKWRINSDEVLATWAKPEEALPVSDEELASYKEASHPLGLRAGVLFKGASGPVCISADPFDDPGLACYVIEGDDTFAARGFPRGSVRSVSGSTLSLYIRPTPFDKTSTLTHGTLVKKPYGGYFIMDKQFGYLPALRPVTSMLALRSWQMTEADAVEVWNTEFWERNGRMEALRFRPGTILQSRAGAWYVVSGEYRHWIPTMDVFQRRGYNNANVLAVSDEELALHKEWPTPLK
jgi:murein DD-endopeptidase MepM/ murein hydrolase activator NlpD